MTRHGVAMLGGYVAIASSMVALGFAVHYGNVAGRSADPRRFGGSRWLAFLFPPRGPEHYTGVGWRFRTRQLVALLVAVAFLFVAAFLTMI